MEKQIVDIKEALTYMFQKDWWMKALVALLLSCPAIILGIVAPYISFNNVLLVIYVILALLLSIFGTITVIGYIQLYAHDRALDKNAKFRDWSVCILDAFWAGLKFYIGMFLISCIIALATLIVTPILGFLTAAIGGLFFSISPVLGMILSFLLTVVPVAFIAVFLVRFFVKITANFMKDLKLVSWFKLKEAFSLTKNVPFGKKAVLVAIGLGLAYFGLAILLLFLTVPNLMSLMMSSQNQHIALPFIPTTILTIFGVYITLYWQSLYAQFTYNSISKNMNVEPETLSKEINKDKKIVIIVGSILILIPVILMCLAFSFAKKQVSNSSFQPSTSTTTTSSSTSSDNNDHMRHDPFFIKSHANWETRKIIDAAKNSGAPILDMSSEGLRDYFAEEMMFSEKAGKNQLLDTSASLGNAVFTFHGDGSCKNNGCYVTVNLYGDKGPNEKWTNPDDPKDIFDLQIKADGKNKIKVIKPDFIKYD